MVFGEHGPNMVIQSISLQKHTYDLVHLQKELTALATKIRQTEKGTKYGVVACALSLFASLQSDKTIEIPLCAKLNDTLKSQLAITENLYLNLLVQLHPFAIKLPALTKEEKQQLKKAVGAVKKAL